MNPNTNTNYLTNSLVAAQQFVSRAVSKIQSNVERNPWGFYKSTEGPVSGSIGEQLRNIKEAAAVNRSQGVYPSGRYSSIKNRQSVTDPFTGEIKYSAKKEQTYGVPTGMPVAASAVADVLTNTTRREVWRYTNLHRMMSDVGQYAGPRLGLESTLAGAAAAAAVPVALGALSGQIGSPLEGLRPRGYKAVAPVSKEEDPSGRKIRSPLLEATMRYALGQRSQLLPYKEFKEERPDVLPSTYSQYRKYERMKPEPGKNVIVDPESASFSALGGVIRGTARGLNDPEVRIKGVPITASAVLGTAAGLGAIKGLSKAIAPTPLGEIPTRLQHKIEHAVLGKEYSPIPLPVSKQIAETRKLNPISIGEKIGTSLGQYSDPALLAAGALTAVAVAKTAKTLFQKAAERRIKKENPVEYLKHKHGSLEQAKAALRQPAAKSWQELTPYVQ